MKTHKVFDFIYSDYTFSGTHEECCKFVGSAYGYRIDPLTEEERKIENEIGVAIKRNSYFNYAMVILKN